MSERKPYPSDLSDEQWALIEPVITAWKDRHRSVSGHQGAYDMREIVNAILRRPAGRRDRLQPLLEALDLQEDATRTLADDLRAQIDDLQTRLREAETHLEHLAITRTTVTGLADRLPADTPDLPEHPDYPRILAAFNHATGPLRAKDVCEALGHELLPKNVEGTRAKRRPDVVLGDRGCDHDKYRRLVWDLGVKPVIARRGTEHGSGLGTQRWVVERAFAHLHWFRRLRIRWEIRDDIHEAFLTLGCVLICWRRLIARDAATRN
ncbi:hypothetical protein [Streptomyces lomondensis]|uniref:Transposase n=1 Tax=Streptomyces lomondensis TaxID=68229 RepID=A0ABQ2X3X1_9ACTN|nr:hypothetical protein [Streptomyces lomondensis]MCF0079797.1 hypothetical protein [Streptomyces lomondensis]GGW98221.1 hypothetical protein GCM10010383_30500 [Streptomyces lomondensis]